MINMKRSKPDNLSLACVSSWDVSTEPWELPTSRAAGSEAGAEAWHCCTWQSLSSPPGRMEARHWALMACDAPMCSWRWMAAWLWRSYPGPCWCNQESVAWRNCHGGLDQLSWSHPSTWLQSKAGEQREHFSAQSGGSQCSVLAAGRVWGEIPQGPAALCKTISAGKLDLQKLIKIRAVGTEAESYSDGCSRNTCPECPGHSVMFASSQGAVQYLNTLKAVVIRESASDIWVWVHCTQS
ncbi:uncharacterized protein LOC127479925 [Manacus candei]|uniref:uncharacterized protein LOC127479925 n=1 Tax=Manacus candei TaxID=415023 RepID=UPI002225BFDC|nr:uncharacterized protein LOC127479925 [Manacus candei]